MALNIKAFLGLNTDKYDKGLKKAQRRAQNFGKGFKQSVGGAMGAVGGQVGGMTGGIMQMFSGLSQGIRTATRGFGTLTKAIAATGIGLLVIAVGTLVAYFTQTQAGADMLKKAMDGLGAVIDAVKDRIALIGGALAKFFKGDWKGAAKDARGAFKGLGDDIKKNYEESRKASIDEINLKKDQIAWIKREKELEAEKSDLLLKSRDKERYNAKERQAFEKAAGEKIKEIGAEKLRLLDEEIRLLKIRQAQGENTYDDDKKLAELEAQRFGTVRDINNQYREIQNRITTTNAEQAAALKAVLTEEKKIIAEDLKILKAQQDINSEISKSEQKTRNFLDQLRKVKEANQDNGPTFNSNGALDLSTSAVKGPSFSGAESSGVGFMDGLRDRWAELRGSITEGVEAMQSDIIGGIGQSLDAFGQMFGAFGDMFTAQMDEELAAAGDNEEKKEQIRKKYAKQRKAMAIGEAIVNAARAVLMTMTSVPFPFNIPLAVAQGIAGAVQVQKIRSQQFANGGIVPGTSYTGDKVPALLNSGEQVLTANQRDALSSKIRQLGNNNGRLRTRVRGSELLVWIDNARKEQESFT